MSTRLRRRIVFLSRIVACTAAVLVFASPVPASDAPPILRRDVGAFALFGRSYVHWDGAASMPGRGASGSNAAVDFAARTEASGADSYVAAPTVTAKDSSHLHFVFASSLVASADVVVDHPAASLDGPVVADVDWPRAPEVSCGGPDVTVDAATSPLALAPGRYGIVTVLADQTLRLAAAGRYELCSLRVRQGATVEAHAGTFVLLRDYLSTGPRARITGDGACGARWIALAKTTSPAPASAGFEFAQGSGPTNRALVEGDFFTPGRITMAQHNDYVGRFWADGIDGLPSSQVSRTLADCRAARCGDGVVDPGEACDDGNNREGDCCTAFCEIAGAGAGCDDGQFCTTVDSCDASGRCVGRGNPCDPPDGDGNCSESCNEETDTCNAPDPDGSPCNDGRWCNGGDVCAGGQCGAHSGSPCSGPDDDANCRETCDEATHLCTAPDPVGAPCNDGRFCTEGEACNADGECAGGASPCPGADADENCAESCDELADSCTAFDDDGARCDDGLFCTASDACDGRGHCRGWGDPCVAGSSDADCSEACDEASASCSAPDRDGTPCDDGLACTLGERCLDGTCTPTGETTCDDSNPCTDEFCAADGSCLREWNSAPCDDGNACTSQDRCTRGNCRGTVPVDCRDDDLCSNDLCDPVDGSCHHLYAPVATCHTLGSSSTRIRLGFSPKDGERADSLSTAWRGARSGDATTRDELGHPERGEAFSVCFFDESAGLPSLAYRLDFDAASMNGTKWKRSWHTTDVSYKLRIPSGTSQGVSQARLVVDKHGLPAFQLKAGANSGCTSDCRTKFTAPPPQSDGRLFAMEPGMTVQWVASTGACWSGRYEKASANTAELFEARENTK